jgi:hypothetical protein
MWRADDRRVTIGKFGGVRGPARSELRDRDTRVFPLAGERPFDGAQKARSRTSPRMYVRACSEDHSGCAEQL